MSKELAIALVALISWMIGYLTGQRSRNRSSDALCTAASRLASETSKLLAEIKSRGGVS